MKQDESKWVILKVKYPLFLTIVALCCECFIFSLHAQTRAETIRTRIVSTDTTAVLVAAHRGDWRGFPENSLEAIESAIQMGVDIVEIDVQRTKDGTFILMHDPRLDRTTTGHGLIADTTWEYIHSLYLLNGCAIRTRHRVPTLEEALLCAKGRVLLNLDKADRYFPEIYALLQRTGTERQVVMKGKGTAEEVRRQYGSFLNDVLYMPIVNLDSPTAEEDIYAFEQGMHPVAYELLYRTDDNPLPFKLAKDMRGKTLLWYNTMWDTMAGAHDDDASLRDHSQGYGYLIDTLHACSTI